MHGVPHVRACSLEPGVGHGMEPHQDRRPSGGPTYNVYSEAHFTQIKAHYETQTAEHRRLISTVLNCLVAPVMTVAAGSPMTPVATMAVKDHPPIPPRKDVDSWDLTPAVGSLIWLMQHQGKPDVVVDQKRDPLLVQISQVVNALFNTFHTQLDYSKADLDITSMAISNTFPTAFPAKHVHGSLIWKIAKVGWSGKGVM